MIHLSPSPLKQKKVLLTSSATSSGLASACLNFFVFSKLPYFSTADWMALTAVAEISLSANELSFSCLAYHGIVPELAMVNREKMTKMIIAKGSRTNM